MSYFLRRSHTSLFGSYFLRAASCARISAAVIGRFSFLAGSVAGAESVEVAGVVVPFSAILPTAAPSVTVSTFFVSSMIFSIIGDFSGVVVVVAGVPLPLLQIVRVRPWVDHQQARLVRHRLDQLDHLFVRFGRDVGPVDFDDTIALAQAGRFRRRSIVHLADVLPGAALFRVQIEAVTVEVGPLHDMAQARFILWGGRRRRTLPPSTIDGGHPVALAGAVSRARNIPADIRKLSHVKTYKRH
uniref:Uncharacterized protein n=1 Tax=Anopheles farauti TaxID=69004 RepID=A0A182PZS9_9DIPT